MKKNAAESPEEICSLFQQYMAAAGDIDLVLSIYDDDMVFLNQAREEKRGKEAFRQEMAPLVTKKPRSDFNIRQVIKAGDIALMHTEWKASPPPQQMALFRFFRYCL